ncbi:hypothetical protein BURPS406E_G0430 [Burkholderia pseudomallei 406e]|nr:hypothetical protein BURPS305_5132 [Burkholderia pseudomallei 305]EDO87014.1 hypothetical protein BURPS406E_G0430 [Burkholderia pseudomallei 406e]EEH26250.1 hypothetical protein BUH_5602 [Burkholderia pseudomallei Pakistan 9]
MCRGRAFATRRRRVEEVLLEGGPRWNERAAHGAYAAACARTRRECRSAEA